MTITLTPTLRSSIHISSRPTPSQCLSCARRDVSTRTIARTTKLRKRMFAWLDGPGEAHRLPKPNENNFVKSQFDRGSRDGGNDPHPFPMNKKYMSQSILSEDLRNEVWKRVQVNKKSVRQVSVELGVEMRRVGAVVRLVELERRMRTEGKQLALPYARAVHLMVPTTPYVATKPIPHESINDLPVHALTKPQIFYPTSESRAFNRVDAGRVFSGAPRLSDEQDIGQGGQAASLMWQDSKREIVGKKGHEMEVLKPADSRIPHPHLIAFEQDKRDLGGDSREILTRYAERLTLDAREREAAQAQRLAKQEASKTRVDTHRWQLVVTDVQATREKAGPQGRGLGNPGHRYGVPPQDRKRGQIKIPTKVEV